MKQNLIAISICTLISSLTLAQQTQTLETKIGERVKLAKLGGANVELIINGVDQFDISVTAIDYGTFRIRSHEWQLWLPATGDNDGRSKKPIAVTLGFFIGVIVAFTTYPIWPRV